MERFGGGEAVYREGGVAAAVGFMGLGGNGLLHEATGAIAKLHSEA